METKYHLLISVRLGTASEEVEMIEFLGGFIVGGTVVVLMVIYIVNRQNKS